MKTNELVIGQRYWLGLGGEINGVYIGESSDHWETEGYFFDEVYPYKHNLGEINGVVGLPKMKYLPITPYNK